MDHRLLPRNRPGSRLISATLSLMWILAISVAVVAQSGRRLPDWGDKKTQPPPAAPDPTPTPSSHTDKIPLITTGHLADIVYSSTILTAVVSDGLIERLNEASLYSVTREPDMNRKEASDRAKGLSNGYVVYFELETGMDEVGAVGTDTMSRLYVNFIVFKPATGKILTQGHVYQRAYGSGGGEPIPSPAGVGQVEYRLRWAGRETGDRVLQALGKSPIPGH